MNHAYSFGFIAAMGLTQVACVAAHGDDATQPDQPTTSPDQPSSTASFDRIYFDTTNTLQVGADVLAGLDLVAGASVQLEVATTDASEVRFELWQQHQDGNLELLDAFDTTSGFVLTNFASPSDGRTFLHFPAPSSPRGVVVHMDCERTSGACTPDLQPGDVCEAGRACASGLVCVPSDGSCVAGWVSGTCVLPSDGQECLDEVPTGVVCGCDGQAYGSACLAHAAGVGVSTYGACTGTTPPPR